MTMGSILTSQNQGWKCPVCGKVWGPSVGECRDCNKPSTGDLSVFSDPNGECLICHDKALKGHLADVREKEKLRKRRQRAKTT